ncbi:MAG: FIST N-terminal domain-containing protein [Sulfitobacter sp.]
MPEDFSEIAGATGGIAGAKGENAGATGRAACVQVAVGRDGLAAGAVRDALAQIDAGSARFVLCFTPAGLNSDAVARALDAALPGVPVFGCSSAGQITDRGYEDDALLLMAFPKSHFRCASELITLEGPLDATSIVRAVQRTAQSFRHTAGQGRLGLVFTDGLSMQEDILISALEAALPDVPLFGGSAADGLQFEETFVLHGGVAQRGAAVVLLIETDLPFRAVCFDHFLPAQARAIVTRAAPDVRKVYEINGAPAAQEYARLVGCAVDDLSPLIFAENPMLIEYRGAHYVRAISDAGADGSLSFLGAIDDGLIMTLGRGQEIIETLRGTLDISDGQGRQPDFILGFDCVLRRLEFEQKQLGGDVSRVLSDARVYGFNTFGEQHQGVHMNQTLVGIAFFGPEERTLF